MPLPCLSDATRYGLPSKPMRTGHASGKNYLNW